MAIKLSRRTVLRGMAGAMVGLPLLEIMIDTNPALAQGAAPRRFALMFAGQSTGGDGWEKDRSMVSGNRFTEDGHWIADTTMGRGFALTTPLLPLAGLRDQFSLVSNMQIPFSRSSDDPNAVPAGGAYRDFHGGACSPLLSGVRSTVPDFTCNGPTPDQVVAEMLRGSTTHNSLVLRAQPSWYLSGSSYAGRQYVSYGGGGGRDGRIEAQASPQVAFQSLFGGFVPEDAAEAARFAFKQRARRSVLDFVRNKRAKLLGVVGQADRIRLERHFDEIRALELQIASLPPVTSGTCIVPPEPGSDPSVGGDNTGSGSDDIRPGSGYSDEHARARLLADLIHMAFVCDLTRVATLQITVFQSHMSVLPVSEGLGTLPGTTRPENWSPIYADLHEVGHNGDQNTRGQVAVSGMLGWHVSHYAYLLDKLKNTPEGDGNVLDNSAVLFVPEGGHGRQLNDATTPNQTHSVENMCMLVGGGAGGLSPGQHIDAGEAHPATCLVSAMQAVGYEGDTLGEVSGNIPELFG